MASLVRRRDWPRFDWPDWFGQTMPEPFFRFGEMPDVEGVLDREAMKLEEFEEDGTLVVRAEMPGIDPDKDVEITMSDNVLRISAERKEETKTEEKGRYRSEFHYGRFVRQVPLPAGATMDDVKATYKDGILEVRVPVRSEKAEATKVPVTRE